MADYHVVNWARYQLNQKHDKPFFLKNEIFYTYGDFTHYPEIFRMTADGGRMECFSRKFVEVMTSLLDSDQLVIATVARKGGGFIGRVKQRADVEICDVTRDNRDALADKIVDRLRGNWRQISRDSRGIERTF
jgi:hypothetical protein